MIAARNRPDNRQVGRVSGLEPAYRRFPLEAATHPMVVDGYDQVTGAAWWMRTVTNRRCNPPANRSKHALGRIRSRGCRCFPPANPRERARTPGRDTDDFHAMLFEAAEAHVGVFDRQA